MKYTIKTVHWAILVVVLVVCIALSGCVSKSPLSANPVTPTTTPIELPGTGPTITIQNLAFTPATITVPRGTIVTWMNQDSVNHLIVSDAQGSVAQGALFTSSSLPKGAGYSFKFNNPGTFPYHCSIHPSMKGTVIVT